MHAMRRATWASVAIGAIAAFASGCRRDRTENRASIAAVPSEHGASIHDGAAEPAHLATGNAHACLLSHGAIRCWGNDLRGQVGAAPPRAAQTTPVVVEGARDVVELALGGDRSCAIARDGGVWCWGAGLPAERGHAPSEDSATPRRAVFVPASIGLALGESEICALLAGRDTRCWGGGGFGVRPDEAMIDVAELRLDDGSLCARTSSGSVRCKGNNRDGELGDGTFVDRAASKEVVGVTRARGLARFLGTTCATLEDRTARCWGWNVGGMTGDGTFDPRATPSAPIGLPAVEEIALGGGFGCARTSAGSVSCWGTARRNPFGSGPRPTALQYGARPVAVPALTDVVELRAGEAFVCALRRDESVWCWGYGDFGELGDGTMDDHETPVRVQL